MVHGGPDRIEVVTPDLDDVLEWDVRWSSESSGRDTDEVDADVAGTRMRTLSRSGDSTRLPP